MNPLKEDEVRNTEPHSISFDVLRAALREAVARSSVRVVAAQVGLSPAGLHVLLADERNPRNKTLHRLSEWYVRHASTRRGVDRETANAAIDMLLGYLPHSERTRVTATLVTALLSAYGAANMHPPGWLASVAAL